MTSVSQDESEKFQSKTPEPSGTDQPPVENVWAKRTLEKQMSASGIENKSQIEAAKPLEKTEDCEFQEVKTKKDKINDRKDDKVRKTEKKDFDKKDCERKDKKGDKETEEKREEIVKKFDNVNFVEAPLPKTNPWAVTKPIPTSIPQAVIRSHSSEAGVLMLNVFMFYYT